MVETTNYFTAIELSLIYGHQKDRAECYGGFREEEQYFILQRMFDICIKNSSNECEFCF